MNSHPCSLGKYDSETIFTNFRLCARTFYVLVWNFVVTNFFFSRFKPHYLKNSTMVKENKYKSKFLSANNWFVHSLQVILEKVLFFKKKFRSAFHFFRGIFPPVNFSSAQIYYHQHFSFFFLQKHRSLQNLKRKVSIV